jgi:hypothetical protein
MISKTDQNIIVHKLSSYHNYFDQSLSFFWTMASVNSILATLTVVLVHSISASSIHNDFDLPSDKEWMSLTKSVDFMPASNNENSAFLRKAQNRLLNYYKDEFVDGLETQYDEYAQAWRYLGLFVDCNVYADNKRRVLEEVEAEDEEVAEEEQAEEEVAEEEEEEVVDDGKICKRYLLWAAVRFDCFIFSFIITSY